MPRSIKRPQTGSPVWYFPNPAPAAPLAAVVTQTVSWSDATETGTFNLFTLSQAAVGSAVLAVPYTQSSAPPQVVTAAAVQAGGSGYAIGDRITLTNGVVLQVATLSTTAVATATVVSGGASYTASPPANPVAQVSTTGGGTAATFNLTWSSGAWCTYPRAFESTASAAPMGAVAPQAASAPAEEEEPPHRASTHRPAPAHRGR